MSQLSTVEIAIDLYCVDNGVVPTTEQGLAALVKSPGIETWKGTYLECHDPPSDGWGKPLKYIASGEKPRVSSAGPDGEFGSTDDMDLNTKLKTRTSGSSCTR